MKISELRSMANRLQEKFDCYCTIDISVGAYKLGRKELEFLIYVEKLKPSIFNFKTYKKMKDKFNQLMKEEEEV